ncbi:methionyl-tRNA formyltransferase [uncultured Dokdonia sp.]|uniref:methionyl-tRNA formyltransferase n=1 Tax=uncultured Dokdonia sp. TaxID=575653 RepID=UPI00260DB116|nr:methionyl-tRNA formyltransferase [uncultured Dokdonia sp.]
MREIRIVFMGTPDFAVTILETLVTQGYTVVGVITAPDRPAGRGQKLRKSAVKVYAESQGLTILQPTNLKNESFLTELEALQANLQIVVAFRILPAAVWKMPAYGTFNLHASLLPQYRGAAPINWAIINGETETGVTTFFIDEKIDTGAVIFQERLTIGENENAGSLHDRLMHLGSGLVTKTVDAIANNTITTHIQPQSGDLKTAYKLYPENTKIDWEAPLKTIHNHIRGLSPYPGSWCYLMNNNKEERVKIYAAEIYTEPSRNTKAYSEIVEEKDENTALGTIQVEDGKLKVTALHGYLYINEIQLPGKRKMDVKSLLNGYNFDENVKMR